MGLVYLAWDPTLERPVALKTTRADLQLSDEKAAEYRERFMREARLAGGLRHPSIVTVYDVGMEDDVPYFAMEYVPGIGLDEVMKLGRNDVETILDTVRKVAAGLQYAHASGVVHRDIKPANVLVGRGGEVKITDFGIARPDVSDLTHEGQMLGSPSYMSPEQVRGREVGPSSDLFSLGVVLYAWLSGTKPFAADSVSQIIHRILSEEPQAITHLRPDLSPRFDAFFRRALAKDPDGRFPDAQSFYRELAAAFRAHGHGEETGLATATVGSTTREPAPAAPATTAVAPPPARGTLDEMSHWDGGEHTRADLIMQQIARSARGHGTADKIVERFDVRWIAVGIALLVVGLLVWVVLK
jgi:serine/threonine-protein kinase